MSYRIGLVGKPSVGKSSFFNAATMNDVPEGAYPFTTIDPSVGEAYVRVDGIGEITLSEQPTDRR